MSARRSSRTASSPPTSTEALVRSVAEAEPAADRLDAVSPAVPEPAPDTRRALARVVFPLALVFILVAYVLTAAPGAWWGDGLELAAAASVLGIPHPPGYPLYMLVGHALIRIFFFTDPGRVLTLFSAFCCAISSVLIAVVIYRRLIALPRVQLRQVAEVGPRGGLKMEAAAPVSAEGGSPRFSPWPPLLVGFGFALTFAFSRTLWQHATFTEVYPLTLLIVSGIVAAIAWPLPPPGSPSVGRILLIGGFSGLALTHHYSAVAVAPLALISIVWWGWRAQRLGRYLSVFFAIALPHLLLWLYLPLRAQSNPPINWGDPSTFDRFLWMLGGGQFAALNLGADLPFLQALSSGLTWWLQWWGSQALPESLMATAPNLVALVGGGIVGGGAYGCALLSRERPALSLGLVLSIAITAAFPVFYRIPDLDGYILPALPAVALGWAELLALVSIPKPGRAVSDRLRLAIAFLPIAAGLVQLAVHWREVDKSWDDGPRRWAHNLLEAVPENALVITRQTADAEIFALWYAQMVEGLRPDVAVFGSGFIFSEWYRRHFETRQEADLRLFIADRPIGTKETFDVALAGGVIVPNLHRPIFMTWDDPILNPYLNPEPVARLLPLEYYERTAYRLIPPGNRLYRVLPDAAFIPVAIERFQEMFAPGSQK